MRTRGVRKKKTAGRQRIDAGTQIIRGNAAFDEPEYRCDSVKQWRDGGEEHSLEKRGKACVPSFEVDAQSLAASVNSSCGLKSTSSATVLAGKGHDGASRNRVLRALGTKSVATVGQAQTQKAKLVRSRAPPLTGRGGSDLFLLSHTRAVKSARARV